MGETSETVLRKAHRGDVDAIHSMILGIGAATNQTDRISSDPIDFLRHGFGPTPLFEAVIAERDDRPVGLCLYFFTFSTWLGEPGIYVQDLFVDSAERGSGLGRRLLVDVARRGAERKATHLRLSVDTDNVAARAFYERLGMEHRDTEETMHLGGAAYTQLTEADA